MIACAVFFEENRLKWAEGRSFTGKPGEASNDRFYWAAGQKHSKNIIFVPRTLWRTWGNRPLSSICDSQALGGTTNGRDQHNSLGRRRRPADQRVGSY